MQGGELSGEGSRGADGCVGLSGVGEGAALWARWEGVCDGQSQMQPVAILLLLLYLAPTKPRLDLMPARECPPPPHSICLSAQPSTWLCPSISPSLAGFAQACAAPPTMGLPPHCLCALLLLLCPAGAPFRICAFNLQRFAGPKAAKVDVMDTLVKVRQVLGEPGPGEPVGGHREVEGSRW